MTAPTLLRVQNLTTEFRVGERTSRALDAISFDVRPGEILGLVGESGCGKSTTGFSVMRLLPRNASITGGEIWLDGDNLLDKSDEEMRAIRGGRVAMIFQDPMTSLDPAFPIGDQIVEVLLEHRSMSRAEARREALRLLREVGIPAPERRIDAYPHEFSGGMRQRIVIAIAIACDPQLLIADEPTTALDVTIQAQILRLLRNLNSQRRKAGILLITHDLGVVAQLCDRVAVMYAGKVVEIGAVQAIFGAPQHPYTQALLASLPGQQTERGRLQTIEGVVPSPLDYPSGCRFHPRCPHRFAPCALEVPPLIDVGAGQAAACHLHRHAE